MSGALRIVVYVSAETVSAVLSYGAGVVGMKDVRFRLIRLWNRMSAAKARLGNVGVVLAGPDRESARWIYGGDDHDDESMTCDETIQLLKASAFGSCTERADAIGLALGDGIDGDSWTKEAKKHFDMVWCRPRKAVFNVMEQDLPEQPRTEDCPCHIYVEDHSAWIVRDVGSAKPSTSKLEESGIAGVLSEFKEAFRESWRDAKRRLDSGDAALDRAAIQGALQHAAETKWRSWLEQIEGSGATKFRIFIDRSERQLSWAPVRDAALNIMREFYSRLLTAHARQQLPGEAQQIDVEIFSLESMMVRLAQGMVTLSKDDIEDACRRGMEERSLALRSVVATTLWSANSSSRIREGAGYGD